MSPPRNPGSVGEQGGERGFLRGATAGVEGQDAPDRLTTEGLFFGAIRPVMIRRAEARKTARGRHRGGLGGGHGLVKNLHRNAVEESF